jgi:ornithine carbamoyltransferase
MKHFLSIEECHQKKILDLVSHARAFKADRRRDADLLASQSWVLIFSKPSTRTRISFEVGLRELGAQVLFLAQQDIQLGRGEPIKDTARVLGRMIRGAVIRTFAQQDVEDFANFSQVPTINALTDEEHPCQIIADLFTISERRELQDIKVCFVGDGDCNVARSWAWAAEHLGFELRIAAPAKYGLGEEVRSKLKSRKIIHTQSAQEAATEADVLYTDVWVSMGKEAEMQARFAEFAPYQINEQLLRVAQPGALVMHCLPAYRGKEITEAVFEAHADTIFDQAENRLHAQKAIVAALMQ